MRSQIEIRIERHKDEIKKREGIVQIGNPEIVSLLFKRAPLVPP